MVCATVRLVVPFKHRAEVLEILASIAERARFEPGCISCRVYQGMEGEHVVMLEERWRSEEQLQSHLRSEEYHKVLLVAEMSAERPEIRFDLISKSTGVETIRKARGHGEEEESEGNSSAGKS